MDVVRRSPAYNIYEDGIDLCRHIKFRRRRINQKKEYNTIQYMQHVIRVY